MNQGHLAPILLLGDQNKYLEGTLSQGQTLASDVTRVQSSLAATLSQAQTLAANISSLQYLTATLSQTQTLASAITRLQYLAATLSQSQALASAVDVKQYLAATLAQDEVLESDITITSLDVYLTAALSQGQTLASAITTLQYLAGTLSQSQTLASNLSVLQCLTATLTQAQTLASSVAVSQYLATTLEQLQDLASDMLVLGAVNLAASLSQEQALASSITRLQYLASTLSQSQTLSAEIASLQRLTATLSQGQTLASSITREQRLAASLSQEQTLSASATVQQRLAATLAQDQALAADMLSQVLLASALSQAQELTAELDSEMRLSAALEQAQYLAAEVDIRYPFYIRPDEVAAAVLDALLVDHCGVGTVGWSLMMSAYQSAMGVAVHIDTVDGQPGTVLGVNGTRTNPVTTEADARVIADLLQIRRYMLVQGELLLTVDHQNWEFSGAAGTSWPEIDMGGRDLFGSTFDRLHIEGDLAPSSTGEACVWTACHVGPCTGITGRLYGCTLRDVIQVGEGGSTHPIGCGILECHDCSAAADTEEGPVRILAGHDLTHGRDIQLTGWKGTVEIHDVNNANTRALIVAEGADIFLADTCDAGTIKVDGVAHIHDDSAPGCAVDTSGVLAPATVAVAVWDEPLADHPVAGSAAAAVSAIVNGLTEGQALQLLELWRLNGLEVGTPVTASPTSRTTAGITQALTGPDVDGRYSMVRLP
jgi:hypothetical protein